MCGFCNVWVCVCVGFVMCGCVCIYGFCNVWVCVYMGLVMCGCFNNCVGVLVKCVHVFSVNLYCLYCVFVLFRICIFILIC
jgi:hypothetical protein